MRQVESFSGKVGNLRSLQRQLVSFLFLCAGCYHASSQAPGIVKAVGGSVLEPKYATQRDWTNNQWNGLFFYQGTGSPTKLCVTEGTNAGTVFVANIGSGTLFKVLPAKDFAYIITSEIVNFFPITTRYLIYKSDGTAAGTSLIIQLPDAVGTTNSGQFTSDPLGIFNFSMDGSSNTFYFSAYDATNGNELWVTDGSTAGTHILKDIKAGTGGSFPWGFFKKGNDVYFNCTETGFERKLWKTDGTAGGTVKVEVAEPFFIVNGSIGRVNNKMILFAHNTVDGYEPYVSDGTAAGTFMLGNFNTGGNSLLAMVDEANLRGNSNYCFLILKSDADTSLYVTDGSLAGTGRAAPAGLSVYTNTSGNGLCDVDESGIWIVKYNSAGSGSSETTYRSDGTMDGTYEVAANISYGQKVKIYQNALWMQARDMGSVANAEPWRSGGNAATTIKAFEIEPGMAPAPVNTPFSSNPHNFFVKDGKLYFFASTTVPSAKNLYQYNGDFTFNGSQAGGQWSNNANWNGLLVPGLTDTAYVNAGTPNALTIDGANGYAGTLVLGSNAGIQLLSTTDSLIINHALAPTANNAFTGNGVLAFRSMNADSSVYVNNGFTANRLAILSNTDLTTGDVNIQQDIHLANGKLFTLNTGNITLSGTSSAITQSGNGYFNTNNTGRLFIENIGPGGRNAPVLFPVGAGGNYNPATIANTGADDKFGVRVKPGLNGNYTGEQPDNSAYSSGAVNATWFVTEANAGGSNVDLSLQWNQSQELSGFERSNTNLGHYTGGSWNLGSAGAALGSNPFTLNRTGLTSFSPFGILNSNAMLPLIFLGFSAQNCGARVCLQWKTANEQRVSHFVVERNTDGIHFQTIAKVQARNQPLSYYSYTDDETIGIDNKVYYRIRQVDNDGREAYSKTLLISLKGEGFLIYPTVFNNGFELQNGQPYRVQLEMFAPDGKLILSQSIEPGANKVEVRNNYKGILIYRIKKGADLLQSGKLWRQ